MFDIGFGPLGTSWAPASNCLRVNFGDEEEEECEFGVFFGCKSIVAVVDAVGKVVGGVEGSAEWTKTRRRKRRERKKRREWDFVVEMLISETDVEDEEEDDDDLSVAMQSAAAGIIIRNQ
ncbi:hypothetical protein RHGRI_035945 [Rhododendron griersonianum]|uniref:Uncharacterized protein n=1 Tax=Rhododendron griersonianum TaxID=479676 RepID=A0AAV6HLX6_9ERIC|nr:hypothetical protein RHGRI_035945 [Rhododendron griersonianum]